MSRNISCLSVVLQKLPTCHYPLYHQLSRYAGRSAALLIVKHLLLCVTLDLMFSTVG